MNKRERKKFEKLLLEMREKKVEYIAMLREVAISRTQRDASGDISAFTSHPADISTESDEREKVASLITRETQIVKELDAALERIGDATYGECDTCGGDIPPARLQALPFATLCVKCQAEAEKG
ncbi:MAG TPA: TraR/DksA C4-type zinc finger protein [bacterium]|nr:TraR/DksA C4-type zinc finger protein [bacterium]